MLKLFEPKTKVQKNREIMRETDQRMAKYGRRGLISNFFVFSLCLFTSDRFVQEQPRLAVVLSVGLLLITILRGYFLFRFEAIYPRAPQAWRNKYFISTLIGASWWCVIMGSITLVLGMDAEAPLMWLYTVVFFSTTAHAFSPFKRFLSVYQFIGIIPATLTTLMIGELIGVLYAIIILMFYWILHHHSELMGDTYWGHLDANYNLTRKAESLEEEKRDTRASAQLSYEYIGLLTQELSKQSQSETPTSKNLHAVQNNLNDFYKVLTKDFVPTPRIFNVRHLLQYLVQQTQEAAEKKGIELETAISPALPSRLVGDATLLGQIVKCILSQVVAQSEAQSVFVEMEFTREYEASGQLLITVACQSSGSKRKFFNESELSEIKPSLELVLAKGLADVINGSLEVGETAQQNGKSISFRARMDVAELTPRMDHHRVEYKNKSLILVNSNARWLDYKRLELDTLGFNVTTLNEHKKALNHLMQAINQGQAIDSVVYSAQVGDEQAVDFANELLSHNDLKYAHQFIICSRLGKKYFQDRLITSSPTIHFVSKPSGLYEFEMALSTVYCNNEVADDAKEPITNRVCWLSTEKSNLKTHFAEATNLHIVHHDDKKQLLKFLSEKGAELIVLESDAETTEEIVTAVRDYERKNQHQNLLPIVAVGEVEIQAQVLEAGVDHFVSGEALAMGDATALNYWLRGGTHS